MPLYVYNITALPVTLVAGNGPAPSIPASLAPPAVGAPFDVTGTLRGLISGDYTALQAQAVSTLVYKWTEEVEYPTGDLVVSTGTLPDASAAPDGAVPVVRTGVWTYGTRLASVDVDATQVARAFAPSLTGVLLLDTDVDATPYTPNVAGAATNTFAMQYVSAYFTGAVEANVFVCADVLGVANVGLYARQLTGTDSPLQIIGVSGAAASTSRAPVAMLRGFPVAVKWDGLGTITRDSLLELSSVLPGYVTAVGFGSGSILGPALTEPSGGLVTLRLP